MKPQDLEKSITSNRLRLTSSTKMDKRILDDALTVLEETKTTRPAIWRTIMRSPLTKPAIAAVLIIAIMIGMYGLNGSIDMSTVALAQVTENMKKMPWLHMVATGLDKGVRGTAEQWASFESRIWMSKKPDGTILYFDFDKQENRTYDPVSDTITISYLYADKPPLEFSSPWTVIEKMIETFTAQGAQITQTRGEYNDASVVIHEISLSLNNMDTILRLYVDDQSNLLVAGVVKATDADGNVVIDATIVFDYPEKGPADIYEIGVPETATVIDNRCPADVLDALAEYRSHRENMLDEYIAVVANNRLRLVKLIYRNGDLQRTERCLPQQRGSWIEYSDGMDLTIDAIVQWWTNNDNTRLTSVYLYDGQEDHFVYGLTTSDPKSYKTEGHNPNHEGLADIGWPHIRRWIGANRTLEIIETDYSTEHNLICIELMMAGTISPNGKYISLPRRNQYHLDPSRDYLAVKAEYRGQHDASWQTDEAWLEGVDPNIIPEDFHIIHEITEFTQTDSGHWYPKKITKWDAKASDPDSAETVYDIYLKSNPEFPPGIFAVENLPK